jgi:ATP adenylyltransferase
MDALWAPWRLSYVTSARRPSPGNPCFICQGLAENDDRRNLVVLRTPRSVVVLNRFPYNNGHLLIAPLAHKGHLHDLDKDEMLQTMESIRRMVRILDGLMHPAGYNIGLNLGEAAGAGLPTGMWYHAGTATPISCRF